MNAQHKDGGDMMINHFHNCTVFVTGGKPQLVEPAHEDREPRTRSCHTCGNQRVVTVLNEFGDEVERRPCPHCSAEGDHP